MTPALPGAPVGLPVTDRERAFAQAALADEFAKLSAMREGSGRNRALNEAAHSLGTMEGWIDLNAVANALWEASIANGYVAKDGEAQTRATIESGINAGRSKPRPLLASCVPHIDVSAMIANGIAAYRRQHPAASTSGKPDKSSKRSVTLVQCSTIEAKPITWLWNGFIPQAKLTLLAGAGGTGKSTLAFNFAATYRTLECGRTVRGVLSLEMYSSGLAKTIQPILSFRVLWLSGRIYQGAESSAEQLTKTVCAAHLMPRGTWTICARQPNNWRSIAAHH